MCSAPCVNKDEITYMKEVKESGFNEIEIVDGKNTYTVKSDIIY